MRHHVTIVGCKPALQCHPLAGLAIALVRLARPWEEKPRDSDAALFKYWQTNQFCSALSAKACTTNGS